jgi:hypothetical protein
MFLTKNEVAKGIPKEDYLDQLYWLDWRFDMPEWAISDKERSYYLIRRLQLKKLIEKYDDVDLLHKYETQRRLSNT